MRIYKIAQSEIIIEFGGCHETEGTYGKRPLLCQITAKDRMPTREIPVGRLQYVKDDKGIMVFMVYVDVGYRRRGVATAMINKLLEHESIMYSQLSWNNLYPDGKALKNSLDEKGTT